MLVRLTKILLLASAPSLAACGGGGGGGGGATNSTSTGATTGAATTGDTTTSATTSTGGSTAGTTNSTTGAGGTGGSPGGVSYSADVRPLFAERCTLCHHADMSVLNIADPFAAETGLVNAPNTWAVAHPDENPETQNVVPFEPENSFLMRKISDSAIDPANSGAFMPWHIPRLTEEEIATLRQWISDGANDDEVYQNEIRLIFGDGVSLGTAGGKCAYCHYPGGMTPNLVDPFDPDRGAVNVSGIGVFADRIRIVPGDPDASLLVQKVELTEESVEIGEPMPMHYPALTSDQVETVRQWILEGAQDN